MTNLEKATAYIKAYAAENTGTYAVLDMQRDIDEITDLCERYDTIHFITIRNLMYGRINVPWDRVEQFCEELNANRN